jgi:hypothetical protein
MSFTRYRAVITVQGTRPTPEFLRDATIALAASALLLAPLLTAQAAQDTPGTNSFSAHAHATGEVIKQDSKAVGAAFKEGAHRIATAAKAVGHEVATAARRGADKTRAAFRGEK